MKRRVTYPFTVNSHVNIRRNTQVRNLGDAPNMLHVCGVTTCPKDDGYLGFGVDVVRRDKCAGGVIYKSCQVYRKVLNRGRGKLLLACQPRTSGVENAHILQEIV